MSRIKKYKIDENTIWEDTGRIVVYQNNFCKLYKEKTKNKPSKEVYGELIHKSVLDEAEFVLFNIIKECQAQLALYEENHLKDKLI